MIKIEFKEAKSMMLYPLTVKFEFAKDANIYRIFNDEDIIKTITTYIPTQDPYLDRSFILQQLGISKEQDEEMQLKYSKS